MFIDFELSVACVGGNFERFRSDGNLIGGNVDDGGRFKQKVL